MITIKNESIQNVNSVLDIDYWRKRYKTTNNLLSFPSPSISTIEQNYYYLLRNSEIKTFDPKYKMRPSYLSYDEYNTPLFDWFLMYINGVFCLEDFDLDEVIVPSLEAISISSQNKVPKENANNLEGIDW